LYGKIRQLDPSPSFTNAVEQVAMMNIAKQEVIMVNKTLSEIRPGRNCETSRKG
jgi:hypothetical protein